MSSLDRPSMISAATSRSREVKIPGGHEHAGQVGCGCGLPRTAAGPVPPAFPTQQVQNMFRRMFSTKSGASVPAAH